MIVYLLDFIIWKIVQHSNLIFRIKALFLIERADNAPFVSADNIMV